MSIARLDRTVKVGDILTSTAILVPIASLVYTWQTDQQLRRREQANRIRMAAASSLVKLDAWTDISLSYYDRALVLYDGIKQSLLENFRYEPNRNFLWKQLLQLEVEIRKAHLDNDVESGFIDLYTYNPTVRPQVEGLLKQADDIEREAYSEARGASQDTLSGLFYGPDAKTLSEYRGNSALLYNDLADLTNDEREKLRLHLNTLFEPASVALKHLIAESDDELLANSHVALALVVNPAEPRIRERATP